MLSTRLLIALLMTGTCLAQSDSSLLVDAAEDSALDIDSAAQEYRSPQPRELTVLTETLSAEQLDRAVLNRLMQEIHNQPEDTKARIGLSDHQLQEIFITISNARGFINGSEMANVRAMCSAWDSSSAAGDARISEALEAYRQREKHTQTFIARYYRVVLAEIESLLDKRSLPLFRAYMDDRRRRLASAGMTSWGSPVQNISAGTATIDFHCR